MKWGILFRPLSLWIGTHWSSYNKRLCTNLVPCVTIWVTLPGGRVPNQGLDLYRNDRVRTYKRRRADLLQETDSA